MSLLLTAVTLLVPAAHAPLPAQEPLEGEHAADSLFPMPSDDLVIAVGDGGASWTMMDLVQEYGRLTNQHVQVREDTRLFLEGVSTGLTRSVVVPRAQVQSFFEGLLVENDFVMTLLRDSEPRLLGITSLSTGERSTLRASAYLVTEQELEVWRDHPAVLITSVVHMPNSDVRLLSNSTRTMITDANIQQMLPAGSSRSMILTGYADQVADMARMLRIIDDSAAREASSPSFRRIELEHASASEIAPLIENLLVAASSRPALVQGAASPPPTVRVVADPRTNALVVMCLPADRERVETLVALFDVKQD